MYGGRSVGGREGRSVGREECREGGVYGERSVGREECREGEEGRERSVGRAVVWGRVTSFLYDFYTLLDNFRNLRAIHLSDSCEVNSKHYG